jgi:hypothetical protein
MGNRISAACRSSNIENKSHSRYAAIVDMSTAAGSRDRADSIRLWLNPANISLLESFGPFL